MNEMEDLERQLAEATDAVTMMRVWAQILDLREQMARGEATE